MKPLTPFLQHESLSRFYPWLVFKVQTGFLHDVIYGFILSHWSETDKIFQMSFETVHCIVLQVLITSGNVAEVRVVALSMTIDFFGKSLISETNSPKSRNFSRYFFQIVFVLNAVQQNLE